jgi:hypothetical protein
VLAAIEAPDRATASPPRAFPERLPEVAYPAGACVRKVQHCGRISYRGRELRMPGGLRPPSRLQPRPEADGVLDVFFCRTKVAEIDLKEPLS